MTVFSQRSVQRLTFALILFVLSIICGSFGYVFFEHYKFVDAIYMAVITFSTVGFSEVNPLSDNGKIFSIIYIFINLGIFAYTVSALSTFLYEGELRKIFKNIITSREMKNMQNHIIVCGFGKNGAMACEELQSAKRDFVIIEKDEALIKQIPAEKKFNFLVGNATLDETLIEAGIERASVIIIALSEDAESVFLALTARELNPGIKVISKANEVSSITKLKRAGASHVVLPDHLGGVHMAQMITKPFVIEFLDIISGGSQSSLMLEEFSYNDLKKEYRDKSLKELGIRNKTGASIMAFKDDQAGFIFNPSSDKAIGSGDVIIILGANDSIAQFKSVFIS